MAGSRVIVVVDDTILRLLQVTLDPERRPRALVAQDHRAEVLGRIHAATRDV